AADPQGARPDRPGQDRQRENRRLRPRPAAADQPALLWLPGAGTLPDSRTGRSGGQGNPPPGARRREYKGANPVWWRPLRPTDRFTGAWRTHHRRHARAYPGTPAQGHAEPLRAEYPGA